MKPEPNAGVVLGTRSTWITKAEELSAFVRSLGEGAEKAVGEMVRTSWGRVFAGSRSEPYDLASIVEEICGSG